MRRDYWLIILIGALFFLPFLGAVHLFDWDEINFAECAREMLLTGDWFRPQIDFESFWEKPPLFLWMQAISMKIFGINEFAARFPNAIAGIATLLVVYRIGFKLHDRQFAWIWVLSWLGSLLPHFYFRSGIIDPWFNFFIFVGLYGFINFRWQFITGKIAGSGLKRYKYLMLGGSALGLAVMTKGPTAILITALVLGLYWARYRFKGKGYFGHVLLFMGFAGLAGALWFAVEYALHGSWFIGEFVAYQIRLFSTPDSGHGGFLGYHFVVLLIGCFPVSVFALNNLWGDRQSEAEMLESDTLQSCCRSDFNTWMQLLFWVVLILFTIVRTKIIHYSSLTYFPLTYLGAVSLWRSIRWEQRFRFTPLIFAIVGLLLVTASLALPWLGMHPEVLQELLKKDPFAQANMQAQVEWSWLHALPGALLLLGMVASLMFWLRKRFWESTQAAFAGGAAFVSLLLVMVVCNIEQYTQGAVIRFYESKAAEDCYIRTIGFKSYAHLYYGKKQDPGPDKTIDSYENMARGPVNKKSYFVAKITNLDELPALPEVHELYRENGFVFFERIPGSKK